MKLKFLGTAAAEGMPALFCSCEKCLKALRLGGKNLRSRSQALIDDLMLIDYPCDTYYHLQNFGIDSNQIQYCLISHVHEDHFYPKDFVHFRPGISHPRKDYHLHVYGSEDIEQSIAEIPENSSGAFDYTIVKTFEPFKVGKYAVTALKANHGTDHPHLYLISDGEKTMLYAHDTGIFPEETWEYLKASGVHLDLVSMDCTEGAKKEIPYPHHMCLSRNIVVRQRLKDIGAADKSTIFILNHFSHNGDLTCYDDMVVVAEQEGFLATYDGMEVVF